MVMVEAEDVAARIVAAVAVSDSESEVVVHEGRCCDLLQAHGDRALHRALHVMMQQGMDVQLHPLAELTVVDCLSWVTSMRWRRLEEELA